MSTMVRTQYAQLMAPGVHKIFNQFTELMQRDLEYPALFKVEKSSKAYEDTIEFAGMPPAVELPENTSVSYVSMIQGATKRVVHLMYALGARASHQLMEDDQYNIINKIPVALAHSMQFTKESVAWSLINGGFSTTITIDGKTLFNNQHPLLGGSAATNISPGLTNIISAAGTYPNRPVSDVDLSLAGIQLMTNQFERLVDAQGMPAYMKPKTILVAPANRYLSRELLGSPGKPGTATNEINALLGEDLGFATGHYLTSDTAWFAFCAQDQHQLIFFDREAEKMDMDDDFDTGALKYKTTARYSVVANNWLGTWGSNGP